VLKESPALADGRDPHGAPVLFALPDDEGLAAEAAELLLDLGAGPRTKNNAGETPAEAARKRGLDDAADVIEAAGG
jgi:ankyrin repeat protein